MTNIRFKKNTAKHDPFTPMTVIMLVFLCLFTLALFTLLGWGIMTAFKHQVDYDGGLGFTPNRTGFPRTHEYFYEEGFPLFTNITTVFEHSSITRTGANGTVVSGIGDMILWTILYAFGCAFFNTLVPFLTAYMCARYKNFFSKIVYSTAIVVMAIPIVGSEITSLSLVNDLGLFDKFYGLWILKANYLGTYFLVFYATFSRMPKDYSEAAMIDGAGNFKTMTRICLPLAKGEFLTVFLINFIGYWNDYQTPNLYTPTKPTLSYNLFFLLFGATNDPVLNHTPAQITASVMLLLPVLILFLCFQKKLLTNLSVGGIKG